MEKNILGEYERPIEEQLDMQERSDRPRGENVEHRITPPNNKLHEQVNPTLTQIPETYEMTMEEENREGAEATGDEHSLGLQGDLT
jgi:hypothetical protein